MRLRRALRRKVEADRAFASAEQRLATLERLALLRDELDAKDRKGRRRALRLARRRGLA